MERPPTRPEASHSSERELDTFPEIREAYEREQPVFIDGTDVKTSRNTLLEDMQRKYGYSQADPDADESPTYENNIQDVLRQERIIDAPLVQEAIKKRNELLEGRGLFSLSKEEFTTYFASDEFEISAELKQQNVGDCYAVAALHALSNSSHYEMIVRAGMKRLGDGTWEVRLPLLDRNGEIIVISPDEIESQWNKGFLKRKEGKLLPDIRPRLRPVKGKEGLRVLEAAFIKAKFGMVDRRAAEGGWGDEVLLSLGGEAFLQRSVGAGEYDEGDKKWIERTLDALPSEEAAFLDDMLVRFDPELYIATAATKHFDNSTVRGMVAKNLGRYKGAGTLKTFVPGHAYSISNIDTERKIVNLANPWDTRKKIELTFDQFKQTFTSVGAVRIDVFKLLTTMDEMAMPYH